MLDDKNKKTLLSWGFRNYEVNKWDQVFYGTKVELDFLTGLLSIYIPEEGEYNKYNCTKLVFSEYIIDNNGSPLIKTLMSEAECIYEFERIAKKPIPLKAI